MLELIEYDENERICDNCQFHGNRGMCQRKSPIDTVIQVRTDDNYPEKLPVFPAVRRDDWCGEFERKKDVD